jgi:hypothetical protein
MILQLINLLRNVLDIHALSLQTAQLTRERTHANDNILSRHPRNAPEWTYRTQETPNDTDFSVPNTPNDTANDEPQSSPVSPSANQNDE